MKPKTSSKHKKTGKPKEKVLPTTANTLRYQGLFPNGLMQVTSDYFSQSYLLGDVNYQTVGLEDKGAIMETYSDLINSLDDKTNFQLTIFNQRVNLDKFRKSVLYPMHEDGYDTYREELNRIMENNLEAGENNFSAIKLISFGKSDQNPKLAYRSLSQIGEYFKSGFSEIDANFTLLNGESRVNHLADMLRGENHLPFTYQDLVRSGQTTKHFIAPTSLSFKHKNYIEIDDRLLQIVYVRDYGMELGDKFLRELMQSDLEVVISLHAKGSTKLKEADTDTEIIIVDPENEYSIIGQSFGGESIDIAPDSTTFLNVLDLSDDNMDEDPIKVKSEFLLSWIGKLLDRKMDGREKSLIDRVTRLTYKHFETPSLVEWVFVLSKQPEQEAKDLALDMELYVEGSLDIFSHHTNIKTDSHFLIYNVKKLGDELKQIALMVIFDQIWNRVVKNQKLGKKTWIYFDEMQLLLLDKYASDFFFKLWSRVRKYGAIPTGITQNVETLLLDANGRRIIANSEFMILLKQAKNDREELVHLLGLSKELEKYLINPEKGAGLIKAGSTVVPFRNKIPHQTKLFDIMSTDPEKMRTEA
ncbi:hypothetical protein J5E70_06980 [Streptococcus pneumoniae]|nr:hypothetical protein [Streptococcus pneumoniae]